MLMEEMPTAAAVLFVTVRVWLGLSPIVYPLLKEIADGDKVSAEVWELLEPVPVSETVSVPVERFTVSVPVLAPPTEGANLTLMVQFEPAAREEVQVVASEKSPANAMLFTEMADGLLLLTVTV
jgi:hypothetical protein